MTLRASVAVITYNAEETLKDCLDSILNQDLPKHEFEVLLVDAGSTDRTLDIAHSYPALRVITDRRRGRGLARNLAIEKSKADVIAFIDADCIASPNWLRTHLEILKQSKSDALGGAVLYPPAAGFLTQIQHHLYFGTMEAGSKARSTWDLATCNISFRRQALVEIGFFDNKIHRGEDTVLCWNLMVTGFRVNFHPGPVVMHIYPHLTIRNFLNMKRRDGSADHQLQLHLRGSAPYWLPTHRITTIITSPFLLIARILRYASKTSQNMGLWRTLLGSGWLTLASFYWLAGYLGISKEKVETLRI